MAKDQRTILRRIFPTAHKLILNRVLEARLNALSGDVLVIGAGKEAYARLVPRATSLCCTDVEIGEGIDKIADAHALPFLDNSFDCVIAIEVFEHLRDPKLAASEIKRVLRDGGRAILTIPFMFRIHGDPFDFHRFTNWGLEQLFTDFAVVKVRPFGNRIQVISDILTTAGRWARSLRIINHIITIQLFSKPSLDCPTGFLIELSI